MGIEGKKGLMEKKYQDIQQGFQLIFIPWSAHIIPIQCSGTDTKRTTDNGKMEDARIYERILAERS